MESESVTNFLSNESIRQIVGLLVAAIVGAIITYFSQPLTERRLARIRTAEKIADLRIFAFNDIWALLIELDKARTHHELNYITRFISRYPYARVIYDRYGMLCLQKIFLSRSDFVNYANRFSSVFLKHSILLDESSAKLLNTLNIYLQYLVHYIADEYDKLNRTRSDSVSDEYLEHVVNQFVEAVGIFCHDDIRYMLVSIENSMIQNFENPRLFHKKRKYSIAEVEKTPFYKDGVFFTKREEIVVNFEKYLSRNPDDKSQSETEAKS